MYKVLLLTSATLLFARAVADCPCEVQGVAANCGMLRLNEIPECLPGGSLRELYVDNNNISEVTATQLRRFPRLRTLSMEYNGLRALPADLFRFTPRLRDLDLSGNLISELEPLTFVAVPRLQKLDLSYNNITKLRIDTFRWATSLQELDLSNNNLSSLPTGAVPGGVRSLRLVDNQLTQLPERWPATLEELDLSGNWLASAEAEPLRKLDSLSELHLENNPWNCTCHLLGELARLVIQRNYAVDFEEPMLCATPSNVSGRDALLTLESCFHNADSSTVTSSTVTTSTSTDTSTTKTSPIATATTTTTTKLNPPVTSEVATAESKAASQAQAASTSPPSLENSTAAAAITALTTIFAAGVTAAAVVNNANEDDSVTHPRDILKIVAIIMAVVVAVMALVFAMRRVYVIWPASVRITEDSQRLVPVQRETIL